MWLCASDSKCNQASVVIIDLYFVKSEAEVIKSGVIKSIVVKSGRIFSVLLIKDKITSINPKLFPQIFHQQVHFPMKKLYHPIPYKKPISTTLMSVHTTQGNRQYSINNRCQKSQCNTSFQTFQQVRS